MDREGVVLVTGVGQGFGRAVALGWGGAGYDVVCADRDVAMASKTAAEIEEAGGQAIPIQIDVTVPLDVRHAFQKVDELFGALDGVVHVATRASHARAADLTDGEFAELVDETLRSTQLVLRTSTRLLERAWIVLVTPPTSADAPQNEMVRGGMVRLAAAYGARYPAFRVNAIVPSRSASDPQHDAPLVQATLWLGSEAAAGVGGLELPVLLPPPPRVTESLLPEIQAALDDRVRQDDLEAELWGAGEEDDEGDEGDEGEEGDDEFDAYDEEDRDGRAGEALYDDALDDPAADDPAADDPAADGTAVGQGALPVDSPGERPPGRQAVGIPTETPDRRRARRADLGELNDENRPPDHLLSPGDDLAAGSGDGIGEGLRDDPGTDPGTDPGAARDGHGAPDATRDEDGVGDGIGERRAGKRRPYRLRR